MPDRGGSSDGGSLRDRSPLVRRAIERHGIAPNDAVRLFEQDWTALRRRGVPVDRIDEGKLDALLEGIAAGWLHREGFVQALLWLVVGSGPPPRAAAAPGDTVLRQVLRPWVREARAGWRGRPARRRLVRRVMGTAMTRFAGRVAGRRMRAIVEEVAGAESPERERPGPERPRPEDGTGTGSRTD